MPIRFKSESATIWKDPPVKRSDSDMTAGSKAVSSSSEKSSRGAGQSLGQSAMDNLKRFSFRLRMFRRNSAESSQCERRRISTESISTPKAGTATSYQSVRPLEDDELHPAIETFWRDSKANFDSAMLTDWARYEALDTIVRDAVAHLKARLSAIDAKANAGIDELRITAYEQIRAARQAAARKNLNQAGSGTKKAPAGRLPLRHMMNRRPSSPAGMETEYDATVGEAIGRFRERIDTDFVRMRSKDTAKACSELLQEHFREGVPEESLYRLYQLVNEISPDAMKRFLEKGAASGVSAPLSMSIFTALSEEARGFLAGTSRGRG